MLILRTFVVVLLLSCSIIVGVVAAKSSSNYNNKVVNDNNLTLNANDSFKNPRFLIKNVTPEPNTNEDLEDQDSLEVSYIIVSLKEQRFYAFNKSGKLIFKYPISSGRGGMGTPTGKFRIWHKATATMSRKYKAMMYHWMAFTPSGSHGFHGLAGRSYYNYLGSPASHGCVRLAREDAKEIYPFVKIGTPVEIIREGLFEPVLHIVAPVTQDPQLANSFISNKKSYKRNRNKRTDNTTSETKLAKENVNKEIVITTKPQKDADLKSQDNSEAKNIKDNKEKIKNKAPKPQPKDESNDTSSEDGVVYF